MFGEGQYGKYHHMGGNGEITSGRSQSNGECVPIVIDGVHDALIDPDTFQRCQDKLAERSVTGRKPRYNRYLLSGVLSCGHCGGPLAGKGYSKGKGPRYYACVTGNTRPGACSRYQIRQGPIEDYVLGVIEGRLLAEDAIDRIKREIHRQAKAKPEFKGEARGLKAKIDAMDRKIAKGTENLLLATPDHIDDLSTMLADWKRERNQLQSKLEKVAASPDGRTAEETAQRACAELKRLREHLKTGDPMRIRAVVKSLVKDVQLWWEPYGKRNKRLVRGEIQLRGGLEVLSSGMKTGSATLWATDIPIG